MGDGVEAGEDELKACPRALIAPLYCIRPEASVLGWLGLARLKAGEIADGPEIEPEYVRHPDYHKTAILGEAPQRDIG